MENIEELFKKVNKEKILIKGHKEGLKNYLLNSEYFNNEREAFDYKPAFAAVFFSLLVISVSFLFFNNNNNEGEVALGTNERVLEAQPQVLNEINVKTMSIASDAVIEKEDITLYEKLLLKDGVEEYDSILDGESIKILEVFENNIKTRYYFNKDKNILIKTEIINNK